MMIKHGYIQFDETDAVLAKETYNKEEFNQLLKDTEKSFMNKMKEEEQCRHKKK